VLGLSPQEHLDRVLPKIGFVSQDRPLYASFTVADMLTFGKKLNTLWDDAFARDRLGRLNIAFDQQIGKLSGGQQAQIALVLALAKRPEILLLDEPIGSLDPLARNQFLQILMESVAREGQTVLISSHQVEDLEQICDTFLILSHSRLLIADDLEKMLDSHRWLICPVDEIEQFEQRYPIVKAIYHTGQSSRLLIRFDPQDGRLGDLERLETVSLKELILAYLSLTREESYLVSLENKNKEVVR
jgi:ABC-2 type transport system ATP-binding protein